MADSIEAVDPNPTTSPGISKMAQKFNALVNAPPGGAEGAAAGAEGAGAAATPTPEQLKAKADADAATAAAAAAKAAKSGNPLGDDIPASITGRRAADDFRAIKKRAEEAEKKLVESQTAADAKLKEMEAKIAAGGTVDPKALETAKAEADKYKGMWERVALEFDPEFQAKYDGQIKVVTEGLKAALGDDKLFERLISAVQLPEGKFKQAQMLEVMEEMNDLQKMELGQANQQLRGIVAERNAALADSRTKFQELQKGHQTKLQEQGAARGKVFDAALVRAKDKEKGIFLMTPKEGDEAWNKSVTDREALAKHIFEGNFATDEERADAALWAASAQPLLMDAIATKKELADVKEQLAKLVAASPNLGGGGGKGGENTDENAGKGFSGRVLAGLNRT